MSSDKVLTARIYHDDQQAADRQTRQQERAIRHRSRRAWRHIWLDELERVRAQWDLVSDRLGIVWYRDRAQLILYTAAPAQPLKEWAMADTMDRHRLVSQTQGLLAWSWCQGDFGLGTVTRFRFRPLL